MVLMSSPDICEKTVAKNMHDFTLLAQMAQYRRHVAFRLECGRYVIETASTVHDLRAIVQMRRHSFLEDFLSPEEVTDWVDFDEYDLIADHILVKDRASGEILGTYRILCSRFTSRIYSEEQFDLGSFKAERDVRVELGRACIHRDHRNGATLNLVWKGLGHYARLVGARYLFGCASVKTMSQELAESMYWHLAPLYLDNRYGMRVLEKFQFPTDLQTDFLPPWPMVEAALPSLLRSYLLAGAKICSAPALDTVFRCVDFLIVLDLESLDEKYFRRYFAASATPHHEALA